MDEASGGDFHLDQTSENQHDVGVSFFDGCPIWVGLKEI